MRNSYKVKGDKVYIEIPCVNGKIPLPYTEVAIDLKNLEEVLAYPGTWSQAIHQKTGEIYIRGRYSKNGKRDQPVLARYIAEPEPRENTRHLDGDPLNCLECNLINAPIGVQDIQGLPPISPPPVPEPKPEPQIPLKPAKGVSWHKIKRKWEVKPYYQGKRQNLGYWPECQLAEANAAADYVREHGPEAYKAKIEGGK